MSPRTAELSLRGIVSLLKMYTNERIIDGKRDEASVEFFG